MLPVIGITLDSEEPGGYSRLPWYALRKNYAQAVVAAGGASVLLPHYPETVPAILDRIDGLVVTGGAFDIDPALFGAAHRHSSVVLKGGRTEFELAILTAALARDLPVLGICGGQQLLAVALGGGLIQHIPDEIAGALAHEGDPSGHPVRPVPGTRLAAIVGTETITVNSSHHQAVKTVGPGTVVNAVAADGVIEGIEDSSHRFRIGVQWHPEYGTGAADAALFRAFIEACRK